MLVVYFDHLSGAAHTRKLVKTLFSAVSTFFFFLNVFFLFQTEIHWENILKEEKKV